jgi:phosphoserine phosphatase
MCTTERENTKKRRVHTMKKIELFERAIAEQAASLKEWGINPTLFWAYRNSIMAGNEEINFEDVIWDYDIEEIVKTLKENGISVFTISSTFSSLIPTLAEFAKHGFKMAGLTEVKAKYTDWQTGKPAVIPAIRMEDGNR